LRGDELRGDGGEVRGETSFHPADEFRSEIRKRGRVAREAGRPRLLVGATARHSAPRIADRLRDRERRMVPAERCARGGNLALAECGAMRVGSAGLVRCALADDGLAADQRGAITIRLRGGD
jgi:hypothetical protein